MLDKLSWLHLSDFHLTASGDAFSQNVSCKALLDDIPNRLSEEFPLQFVAVTGDIAFSGLKAEYEVAASYFTSLMHSLSLDMSRLCLVPGNHDVDRSLECYLHLGVKTALNSQKVTDEFLGSDADREQLLRRQAAFYKFRDDLMSMASHTIKQKGVARTRYFEVDGLRVAILELNSAWLSGPEDRQGSLLVGERQVFDALNLADELRPNLMVALAHHPFDWLAEFDSLTCANRLVPRIQVIHTGHIHRHHASVSLLPGSQCLHSTAGASHETRYHRNSYNLIQFDLGTGACEIRQFEYSGDTGRFSELESTIHVIPIEGEVQSSIVEIAQCIRETVPEAEEYAEYIAALLTGNLSEVPVALGNGRYALGAQVVSADQEFVQVADVTRLSNLLKISDTGSLPTLMAENSDALAGFAELLGQLSLSDDSFVEILVSRVAEARRIAGAEDYEATRYQEQYLEDLAAAGDTEQVIAVARRYMNSEYPEVQHVAGRYLASALAKSEDEGTRREALDVATVGLNASPAGAEDYCVASMVSVSLDEMEQAIALAMDALGRWPSDSVLRDYCRSLATQSGSGRLRARLDETEEVAS